MLDNIFSEVIVSIIATLLTSASWLFFTWYKQIDPLLRFLGLDTNQALTICYGNTQSDNRSPVKKSLPTTSFDYGDIDATLIIYDRLNSRFRGKTHHIPNRIPDISRNGNIVAIGGPRWNKTTEGLIGDTGSPLYYKQGVQGLIERRKNHAKENIHKYQATSNQLGEIEIIDYGCIICARSNFLGARIPTALIISGYTTYGVLVASRFLSEVKKQTISNLYQALKGSDRFCVIIQGVVKLNAKGEIQDISQTQLVSWIPEQDFLEPYQYFYSS